MLRLLAVTAHPDDEAGCFGGSLRLYSERGVETAVICLTPGQAARNRGKAKDDQELAATRRQEFAEACAMLEVSRAVVLDYPDGQLHRIEMRRPVGDLVRQIREFRPQVMLTLGLEGAITGHTDHSMAGVFATLAFHWAGRSNRFSDQLTDGVRPHSVQKLYYCTAPGPLPNREPVSLPPATARIDIGRFLDAKIAAFHAHQTQAPLFPFFDAHAETLGSPELFHLAASVEPGPVAMETDLFEGIEGRLAA